MLPLTTKRGSPLISNKPHCDCDRVDLRPQLHLIDHLRSWLRIVGPPRTRPSKWAGENPKCHTLVIIFTGERERWDHLSSLTAVKTRSSRSAAVPLPLPTIDLISLQKQQYASAIQKVALGAPFLGHEGVLIAINRRAWNLNPAIQSIATRRRWRWLRPPTFLLRGGASDLRS